jgi:hypothetical protein
MSVNSTSAATVRRPTWLNYWGWGSGDLLGAGAQAVITGWLFYFFTTFCGLTPVESGLILGLPRLLEAISCPLIGYLSDNLRHSRIGKRIGCRCCHVSHWCSLPGTPSRITCWPSLPLSCCTRCFSFPGKRWPLK